MGKTLVFLCAGFFMDVMMLSIDIIIITCLK